MVVLVTIKPEHEEIAPEMVPVPVDSAPPEAIPEDAQPEENQKRSRRKNRGKS